MNKIRITLASIASVLALSGVASATFTNVCPPPHGESGHADILKSIYGGSFTKSGVNFNNGLISAQRLIDSAVAAPSSLSNPLGGDTRWTGPSIFDLTVRAKFAGHSHTFGWIDGASGGTFQPLLATAPNGGTNKLEVTGGEFRWALRDDTSGRLFTSNIKDNTPPVKGFKAMDHLVTYRITGQGITQPTWALFWEDLAKDQCTDCDYNDAVLVISASPIPTPATAGLAALGCLVMAGRRRR